MRQMDGLALFSSPHLMSGEVNLKINLLSDVNSPSI